MVSAAIDSRLKALDRLANDGRPKSALEMLCIERQMSDFRCGHERGLFWDESEAVRAVKYSALHRHWKRPFTGKPFILEPWQEELTVAPLFGWYRAKSRKDGGRRRFNTGYKEVPRKNGKTSESALFASHGLVADMEHGAEVYAAATKRDQAVILFNDVKNMMRQSSELVKRVKFWSHSITCETLSASFKPLSADHNSLHGLNVSRAIVDEVHSHKTRDLWDVLATATGSRLDPLILGITTAGFDRSTICWELHEYLRQILEGHHTDDSFFGYIACAEQDDDPFAPETWRKANPNFGISVREERLRDEARKAQNSPSYENTFRRLHLNQWTEQERRWLKMNLWDECGEDFDIGELTGQPCYAAIDLASTRDVNSLVLLFPREGGRFIAVPFFWIPESAHDDRGNLDRTQVVNWAQRKDRHGNPLIIRTSDNTTDYYRIADDVMGLSAKYDIRSLAYDNWGPASAFVQVLQQKGFPLELLREFRQTFSNFAAPCAEFERLVIAKKFVHDRNPVLRWMAGNVTIKEDPSGNIRPDKGKSSDKIDGIVATLMALGMAMGAGEGSVSVYEREDRGFITIG